MLLTLWILSCISEPDPTISNPEQFTVCSLLWSSLAPSFGIAVAFALGMYFLGEQFLLFSPEAALDILLPLLLLRTLKSENECGLVTNCLAKWCPFACSFCLTLFSENVGVLFRGLSSLFSLIDWASFSLLEPCWYWCPAVWSSGISLREEKATLAATRDGNVPGRETWMSPALFWNKRFQ